MTMNNREYGEMLTIEDAAKRYGMPYYEIRNMCLRGYIHYVRPGRRYWVDADSLDIYLHGSQEPASNVLTEDG